MSYKFCANLSFMFQEEVSLLKRYSLAASAGFKYVEYSQPYLYSIEDVVKAKNDAGVQQILINTPLASTEPGKFGYASDPECLNEFKSGIETCVKYAKALDCKFIHVMSGTCRGRSEDELSSTYISNLKMASGLCRENGLIALIEPINKYSVPDYYMNCYDKALKVLKEVNSDNVKLMLDVFHLQQIKGDLSRSLRDLLPHTAHVQVAQVPDRGEPNSPGEIDYSYIFNLLKQLGYSDYIGLEYKPTSSTEQSLSWINKFGYAL